MKDSFFLTTAFACLFALEPSKRDGFFSFQKERPRLLRQGAELFCAIALLSLVYFLAVESWASRELYREVSILFFFPAAYGAARFRKKNRIFFLAAFAIPVFFIHQKSELLLGMRLGLSFVIVAGMMFFEAFFLGLKERLIFSPVPRFFEGLPLAFLLASSISMILWGFADALPLP